MIRSLARRAPKKNGGFSWGRFPTSDGSAMTWRLFRRDCRNALHMQALTFLADESPADVAMRLRRARHQLRDRVDMVDLAETGATAWQAD